MNVYVVLLRTNLDDLCVAVFSDHAKAYGYAKKLRVSSQKKIATLFGVDLAGPINTAIVQFKNGKPVGFEIVKYFDVNQKAR